ncbi:hypothetical protein EB74_22160 [Mycobacterium sp. SWH-M5]|nr:hypothetical protein EB74_22160 [Mycobacterium sp. SWH-M5]
MVTATIDGVTLRSAKSAWGEHRASIHGKSSLALAAPQAVDEAFDAFERDLLVADQRGWPGIDPGSSTVEPVCTTSGARER